MPIASYPLFFDTSVYIAALLSPEGAAGELIRLAESGVIQMVVSEEVIIEIDRVLKKKYPELIQESRRLLKHIAPEVVSNPDPEDVKPFLRKLPTADAMILCAARQGKISAFVTWNTRDFMVSGIAELVNFPVVVPGEALKLFRKWVDSFAD